MNSNNILNIIGIITIVIPIIYELLYSVFRNRIATLKMEIQKSEKNFKEVNEKLQKSNESNKLLQKRLDSYENKDVKKEINYTRSESVKFYDEISDVYDIDNSKEIWVTHRAIAKFIYRFMKEKNFTISIIDIGGGTGTLLFDLLSLNEKIEWTYVDYAKKMCENFKRKCEEENLKANVLHTSFDAILSETNKKYDIIIFSFLFSSLPNIPDLRRINNLLNENGKIIFADADREYSKRLPYRVVKENTAYILDTKPLKLSDVLENFTSIGFKSTSTTTIKKNGETYSHVVELER